MFIKIIPYDNIRRINLDPVVININMIVRIVNDSDYRTIFMSDKKQYSVHADLDTLLNAFNNKNPVS